MQRYSVIYSLYVNSQLLDVYNYLVYKWGLKVANSFLLKYDRTIQQLCNNPETGRISQVDNKIRSILITKHNRLYYEIDNKSIILLQIFDTRQNPSKNKFD